MKAFVSIICILLLVSCGDNLGIDTNPVSPNPISNYQGPLAIFLEHDMLCSGQSSKIHAVQLNPWKEIPLSEVTFNPIGTVDGKILPSGEYIAPENLSQKRTIRITGKLKNGAPGTLSGEIQVFPKGLYPDTGVKNINYQLGINRPYGVMENGDLVFGSSSNMMHASMASTKELVRISPEGKVVWSKDISPFNSKFLEVKGGKIFSAGYQENDSGNFIKKAFILDGGGGILKEIPLPFEGFIRTFSVSDSEISYYLFKEYEKKINLIVAIDSNGKTLYEKSFTIEIEDIKITSNGNIIGMARLGENESSKQALFSLDPDLENYKVIYQEKLEWPYGVDRYHLLPNNQIGVLKLINQKNLTDAQWVVDILNFDGSTIIKNKVINKSTSGVQSNTEPFLNNVKERDLDQITHVLITKNREVFVAGLSFNQTQGFIEIVNINSENHWYFPLESIEGLGIYPISFIEFDGKLNYTVDSGGKVYSFLLDQNLNFDPCLYPPYWN